MCCHRFYAFKLIITAFVPLKELIESLSPEKRERWERLYMLSDRRSMITHPIIYPHPVTKQPVSVGTIFGAKLVLLHTPAS